MEDIFVFDKNDNGVTLVKCNSNVDIAVIPNFFEGEPVTIIGSMVFNPRIKAVVIPDSVEIIENLAFWYCTQIEEIILPKNLKIIKKSAFSYCKSLTEIIFPQSLEKIGVECFAYCKNLQKIESLSNQTKISNSAFMACNKLEKVDFHTLKFLDFNAVVDIIVKNIYKFDELSKDDKSELLNFIKRRINIKKELMLSADSNIINFLLQNKIKISLELIQEIIQHHIKRNNTAITAILLEYKENNFSKSEITAFKEREELVLIGFELPTFSEFKKKFICSRKGDIIKISGYKGNEITETIPDEIAGGLKIRCFAMNNSNNFFPIEILNVEAKITTLKLNAFAGFKSLKEITLPNTLTTIESNAFYNCVNLKKITLPESLTRLNYGAFLCCQSLEEIVIPSKVEHLDSRTFAGCTSLEKVEILANITSIEASTFFGCKNLQEITIPASVTKIGIGAFQNCTALSKVTFLGEIPEIGENAFANTLVNFE